MSRDTYPHEPEFSLKQVFLDRMAEVRYLWQFKFQIAAACIVGAILGAAYAWYKPVTYTSRLTFVVEEAKGGGGSLLSGLAGQFGLDLGSLSGTGGVLAGDNVQQLLKSDKMIRNTLLTPFPGSKSKTLADRYAETSKLKAAWEKKYTQGAPINFPAKSEYTRLQDSLMSIMINRIAQKELTVGKPDKKLSFFEASVTMHNEELAQLFTERLINEATEFYIETKTRRQRTNVNRLQARADSIGKLLNRRTYTASAANSILLDVNPAYPTAGVNVELRERDKLELQTIYAEIVRNLEISRTLLTQETPTFQVVDEPHLPLKKNRLGYLKAMLAGIILAGAAFSLYLILRR